MAKSGAGSETPPKFFDEIDAVIGTRPQTRPKVVLDSGIEKDTDENPDVIDSTASELSCKYSLCPTFLLYIYWNCLDYNKLS